jgi:Rrf2 family transcriptional regulator, iron-sulfur cluster assembly transcription factor
MGAVGKRGKPRDAPLWMALVPRHTAFATAAVIDIANHTESGPLNSSILSERYNLAPRHFEPLLQALVHHRILRGVRGPHGGYELARNPARITLKEILLAVAVDKSKTQMRSTLRPRFANMKGVSELQRSLLAALRCISVEDLTRRARTAPKRSHRGTVSARQRNGRSHVPQ